MFLIFTEFRERVWQRILLLPEREPDYKMTFDCQSSIFILIIFSLSLINHKLLSSNKQAAAAKLYQSQKQTFSKWVICAETSRVYVHSGNGFRIAALGPPGTTTWPLFSMNLRICTGIQMTAAPVEKALRSINNMFYMWTHCSQIRIRSIFKSLRIFNRLNCSYNNMHF